MATPKDFTNTNQVNGITGTTDVSLRPSNPNTPNDLNINIAIRPTGQRTFKNEIYVQGITEPHEFVAFIQQLAHQLGHEILDRCVNKDIVEKAVEQAAMEVMVDNAIDQILGADSDGH